MRRRIALLAAALLAPFGLVVLARPASAPPATLRVRVMTYNILKGGGAARVDHVVEVIAAAGADIVAIQEPEQHLAAIARGLGFFASQRAAVISRYPIADEVGGGGVRVLLPDGSLLLVFHVHLPTDDYGPHLVRDGAPEARILAAEEIRLRHLDRTLGRARAHLERGAAVVLCGDFNARSHLDGGPIDWPTSRAVERAGFRDAYRTHHRDATARPGYTWTPLWQGETEDRIDYIHLGGPLRLERALVVGEGGAHCDLGFPGWQSDHRAVLADILVGR